MECITFDRYIEGFKSLEQYSVEYPYMVSHFVDFTAKNFPSGFHMLDIGAGTGSFSRAVLDRSTVPVLSYTGIEPSLDHVVRLKKRLLTSSIPYEVINACFTPDTQLGKTFDLIMLSHSAYCFMPDPEPFLLHAMTLLNPDGNVLIYHGTPSNFCNILNCLLSDILPPVRVTDPTYTSWKVRDILDKHAFRYTVTYLPGYLRAHDVFQPENTRLLHELITFSLMVEAESFDPPLLSRIEELMKSLSYPSAEGPLLNLGVDAIEVSIQTER